MFPTRAVWEVLSQPFKRSQTGLFQGKMKQYGNNVPHSKHKTRRTWLPNVQHKRLPSEVLGTVRLKLTTRALKTIKQKGGLDPYLRQTSGELLGEKGMSLRIQLQDKERSRTNKYISYTKQTNKFTKALADTEPRIIRELVVPRTQESAKLAREMAGKALNMKGPAPVEITAAYLASARNYFLFNKLSL